MKTAFYLGSFNPFHKGHYKVIETAFTRDNVDKVVIVPTMQNPWKYNKTLDYYNRCSIISLSILDLVNRGFNIHIDTIEEELEFPYYSIATLNALRNKYKSPNNELFFLCGQDTMNDVPHWKDGNKIINDWNFLVVERPKGSISSTEIRTLVKECKDITPYVDKRVVRIINRYYFYDV